MTVSVRWVCSVCAQKIVLTTDADEPEDAARLWRVAAKVRDFHAGAHSNGAS